jgi:DNA-binding LacI/PurR family transcriptional regulator
MSNKENDVTLLKYQRIRSYLLEMLSLRNFEKGDKFYSENYISKKFCISPMTVRKAFDCLVQEKYIVRKQGLGTFVQKIPKSPSRIRIAKHCTIGILVSMEDTKDSFSQKVSIAELSHCITAEGFVTCISFDSAEKLLQSSVDGIILSGMPSAQNMEILRKSGIPLVGYGYFLKEIVPGVGQNIEDFGYYGAEYLLQAGYKRIAAIGHTTNPAYCHTSLSKGIKRAIKDFGPADYLINVHKEHTEKEVIENLFDKKDRPDVLMVVSWSSVPVIMQMLERYKIKVPEDIGVIVFSAELNRMHTIPKLTVVGCDYKQGCAEVVKMLIAIIRGESDIPQSIEMPVKIVEYNSTVKRK